MIWVLKIGLLAYLGFGVFLYLVQRSFMYFPVAESASEVADVEWLQHRGESLKIWVLNPGRSKAVIYLGGNAEDVAGNIADFQARFPEHTLYLPNYRGYGGSTGSPSEEALFTDALAVYDLVAPRHTRVSVIGRSLGSGVAVYLASQRATGPLVLVTPHDSAAAVAQRMYPVYPVRWMLKDSYQSINYAAGVSVPTLLVVAEHDTLIPRAHVDRLEQAFDKADTRTVVIAGSGHNGISGYDAYWDEISAFLAD